MPQEVIRQRIKFLVQHGELYPQDVQRAHDRRMSIAALVLIVFNTFEATAVAIKFLL